MEGLNPIATTTAIFGSAVEATIGNGQVTSRTIEPMTRQSEVLGQSRAAMSIGVALIEAVPILGVAVSLLLLFR